MKKILLLLTMVSLPTFASVSANVSIASDYIWRGMTQSDGIAVSGGFDYAADSGFYAGIWGVPMLILMIVQVVVTVLNLTIILDTVLKWVELELT